MKYRIKFGDWNTAERTYQTGEIIELTAQAAAGFADKLEPVAEVDEAAPVAEVVVAKMKKG